MLFLCTERKGKAVSMLLVNILNATGSSNVIVLMFIDIDEDLDTAVKALHETAQDADALVCLEHQFVFVFSSIVDDEAFDN